MKTLIVITLKVFMKWNDECFEMRSGFKSDSGEEWCERFEHEQFALPVLG